MRTDVGNIMGGCTILLLDLNCAHMADRWGYGWCLKSYMNQRGEGEVAMLTMRLFLTIDDRLLYTYYAITVLC